MMVPVLRQRLWRRTVQLLRPRAPEQASRLVLSSRMPSLGFSTREPSVAPFPLRPLQDLSQANGDQSPPHEMGSPRPEAERPSYGLEIAFYYKEEEWYDPR